MSMNSNIRLYHSVIIPPRWAVCDRDCHLAQGRAAAQQIRRGLQPPFGSNDCSMYFGPLGDLRHPSMPQFATLLPSHPSDLEDIKATALASPISPFMADILVCTCNYTEHLYYVSPPHPNLRGKLGLPG